MTENKPFHYGGQAVIEGVMIRGRKYLVTALRKPGGDIGVDKQPLPSLYTGKLRQVPLTRGIIALIEALVLGIKALLYSANAALEEEGEKVSGGWVWLMMIVSLAFAVALFFLAPLFLTRWLNIGNTILFNLIEGLIRLGVFVLYLQVVSLMPDIKRVFAYHGAEHKTVNGYEAGALLEIEPLKKYSKAHVRCGGSFLFVVLIIAIIVFTLVGKPALWLMITSRIVLLPVIASLGYEVIYFGARHASNILVKIILAPGMWVQSFTTREPDDKQLEVAIVAMRGALEADGVIAAQPVETQATY
ncbi:MAG: DUF1385 domain-containing protein [Dehalococcoidia bacterium]|nr:DUF1385 domain-containing protein [Dehalococcoidia bacterium]